MMCLSSLSKRLVAALWLSNPLAAITLLQLQTHLFIMWTGDPPAWTHNGREADRCKRILICQSKSARDRLA